MGLNMKDITSFDSIITNRQMQIIKSSLPFIPVSDQKFMSVMVKFQELKNTIELFSEPDGNLCACDATDDPYENLTQMISSIKTYCSDEEKEFVDMAYNMACAFALSGNPENNHHISDNPIDIKTIIKNLLSPEQKSIIENYGSLLGFSL